MDRAKPLLLIALLALAAPAAPGGAAEFQAGNFSLSDELGGFKLLSVTGTGSTDDPLVVTEELYGTDPVTLIIRRTALDQPELRPIQGRLTLVKHVINRSGRVWAGYHVELQEILNQPSTRSDGLSFNQAGSQPPDVEADPFTLNNRRFEPLDRIEFLGGAVDPGGTLSLRLTITDPTPVSPFYLLQDPQLVSAGLPSGGRSLAANAP